MARNFCCCCLFSQHITRVEYWRWRALCCSPWACWHMCSAIGPYSKPYPKLWPAWASDSFSLAPYLSFLPSSRRILLALSHRLIQIRPRILARGRWRHPLVQFHPQLTINNSAAHNHHQAHHKSNVELHGAPQPIQRSQLIRLVRRRPSNPYDLTHHSEWRAQLSCLNHSLHHHHRHVCCIPMEILIILLLNWTFYQISRKQTSPSCVFRSDYMAILPLLSCCWTVQVSGNESTKRWDTSDMNSPEP